MFAATGVLLIALPIHFNVTFGLLGRRFEYPDILRREPGEVLTRFREGGTPLVLLWWAFALAALGLAPVAVLLGDILGDSTAARLSVLAGVLAALVQLLGLIRWPFLVPELARLHEDPERRIAAEVTFAAFNRYLGVAVGEHLGYLLTGAWSALVGVAALDGDAVPHAAGWTGIAIGALLILGSLEFVGPNERDGSSLAGRLVPIAYVAWSLWLVWLGVSVVA